MQSSARAAVRGAGGSRHSCTPPAPEGLGRWAPSLASWLSGRRTKLSTRTPTPSPWPPPALGTPDSRKCLLACGLSWSGNNAPNTRGILNVSKLRKSNKCILLFLRIPEENQTSIPHSLSRTGAPQSQSGRLRSVLCSYNSFKMDRIICQSSQMWVPTAELSVNAFYFKNPHIFTLQAFTLCFVSVSSFPA